MKTVQVKIIIRVSYIKLCKNMSKQCLVYVTRIIKIRISRVLLLLSGIFSSCEFEPPHSWGFMITHEDTAQAVELLWTSDQPIAETSAWQHTQHSQQTSMPPAGFKPAIPAGELPQTHALDSSATGISNIACYLLIYMQRYLLSTALWGSDIHPVSTRPES